MPRTSAIIEQQAEISATPSTPPGGYQMTYPKTNGKWYALNSAGVETEMTNAAGGAAGEMALTNLAPASNFTVTAGYSAYVGDEFEIVDGVEIEIGSGAILEIG